MRKIYQNYSFPIGLILCLAIGLITVQAQTFKIEMGTFGRISPPDIEKDEGNELVALRRIDLLFEPISRPGKKAFVEIELRTKSSTPVAENCCETFAFIGGKPFPVYRGATHLYIRMEREVFNKLKEGSIIFLAYGTPQMIQYWAEKSKNNDFGNQSGERFGRLGKREIKRLPKISETQADFYKRIYSPRVAEEKK